MKFVEGTQYIRFMFVNDKARAVYETYRRAPIKHWLFTKIFALGVKMFLKGTVMQIERNTDK